MHEPLWIRVLMDEDTEDVHYMGAAKEMEHLIYRTPANILIWRPILSLHGCLFPDSLRDEGGLCMTTDCVVLMGSLRCLIRASLLGSDSNTSN